MCLHRVHASKHLADNMISDKNVNVMNQLISFSSPFGKQSAQTSTSKYSSVGGELSVIHEKVRGSGKGQQRL